MTEATTANTALFVDATFTAMACEINLRIADPDGAAANSAADVEALFRAVETECTRFDPSSALMRANRAGDDWYVVPQYCYDAISAAWDAYVATDGRFDPRVLQTLTALGYGRTLAFDAGPVSLAVHRSVPSIERFEVGDWRPEFDADASAVRVGPRPLDLGGIGKGLAVRWASDVLEARHRDYLIEAGGDCMLAGIGPSGLGWEVGIEDPVGGEEPLGVLQVSDLACATSSIKLRRWTVDGKVAHHLIDPRTGAPGGDGLVAVTVVGADPAVAEVWSKSLFLAGADGIADVAARHEIAALWVRTDGGFEWNDWLDPFLIWTAS